MLKTEIIEKKVVILRKQFHKLKEMRKLAYMSALTSVAVMVFSLAISCKEGATNGYGAVNDSTSVDSLGIVGDGVESIMPDGADELFDDFFFNFAANKRLQYERIAFPLKVKSEKGERMLKKEQWQMNYFFMEQGYYTMLLDNIRQLDLVNDTSVNSVIIERIQLNSHNVKQYIFERKNGLWMMTSINEDIAYQPANASFLQFYEKFSADEDFQIKSMDNLVTFTGPDPDDDFNSITGQIVPEQWPSFRPALIPEDVIYNVIYGQEYKDANQKVFVLRGIADGMETEMTFKKKGGTWKLVQFNC